MGVDVLDGVVLGVRIQEAYSWDAITALTLL